MAYKVRVIDKEFSRKTPGKVVLYIFEHEDGKIDRMRAEEFERMFSRGEIVLLDGSQHCEIKQEQRIVEPENWNRQNFLNTAQQYAHKLQLQIHGYTYDSNNCSVCANSKNKNHKRTYLFRLINNKMYLETMLRTKDMTYIIKAPLRTNVDKWKCITGVRKVDFYLVSFIIDALSESNNVYPEVCLDVAVRIMHDAFDVDVNNRIKYLLDSITKNNEHAIESIMVKLRCGKIAPEDATRLSNAAMYYLAVYHLSKGNDKVIKITDIINKYITQDLADRVSKTSSIYTKFKYVYYG